MRAAHTPALTVTLAEYDRQVARGMSENVWQTHVLALLRWCGFEPTLTYHTLNSRGSQAGFPDLVAYRYRAGVHTLVLVELKRQTGRTTPAQET